MTPERWQRIRPILDRALGMAWRGIAVTLGVTGADPTREVEAYTHAYELRDRFRLRERYLAEVGYHRWVTGDREATIQAYQRLLDLDPDFAGALNNLGNMYVKLPGLRRRGRALAESRRGAGGQRLRLRQSH